MVPKKDEFVYLTLEWLEKLKWELEYLKTEKRIEIAEKLKEAISYWDLSENSEYEDARNEQAQIETRIKEIEVQLKNVKIVDSEAHENTVQIGSLVTIQLISDSKDESPKEEYKIMGSTEADILSTPPRISNESPVWKGLMWKKKWAKVKVNTPAWKKEYKIISLD